MPAVELAKVSLPTELAAPVPEIWTETVKLQGGAPPLASPQTLPQIPVFPEIFPQFFEFFGSSPQLTESPLLTPFKPPGVSSSLLANPMALAEPLPEPEPDRCRCRQRKRKAGKPGKGFFTIDSRGREKRRYWLNREQRENARNAS